MPSLSEEDRKAILELARQGVVHAVYHERPLPTFPTTGIFAERGGLFVTLHVAKKLRGCIGVIEGYANLGETLARCAADAALHDPRFSRMRAEELDALEIEVSLLTPVQPMRAEEVEIGIHGLLVEQGSRRGLLLPQVAVEHRLSREQFLAETCAKAGLPRDAWDDPETKLYGFQCEILAEARSSLAEKQSPRS
ncbi:MAG TPA: AmmeMemoRadiSam system protein A [Candidatus Acidoferrales bacterium]|nr:AmmeMemoRadiSam system protein A [Candidatus Acidoferrales bacterium]